MKMPPSRRRRIAGLFTLGICLNVIGLSLSHRAASGPWPLLMSLAGVLIMVTALALVLRRRGA